MNKSEGELAWQGCTSLTVVMTPVAPELQRRRRSRRVARLDQGGRQGARRSLCTLRTSPHAEHGPTHGDGSRSDSLGSAAGAILLCYPATT